MQKGVAFQGLALLGTIAFQISIAIFPQQLQPYAWLMKYVWTFWVGSLAMLILVRITERGKGESKPESTSPTPKSEAAVKNSGNATVNVNLASSHSAVLPVAPAMKHIEVEQLELLKRTIATGPDSKLNFAKPDSKDAIVALLLPIHFNAVKSDPGTEMFNVRSSIVFTCDTSGGVIRVPHGIWLDGTTLDTQDIHRGETKYIILALIDGGQAKVFSTKCIDLRWEKTEAGDDIEDQDLLIARYRVQVVLTWWNQKRVVELELDLTKFARE
jgi:hypothetical protein